MNRNPNPFPKIAFPDETPEEKARRIGVPVFPDRARLPMPPHDPTIGVCGRCGLELKRVMGYCCPRSGCPTGLGSPM